MKDRDKTTMSVSEMRQMLGLKKTDSYLVLCQVFGQIKHNFFIFILPVPAQA